MHNQENMPSPVPPLAEIEKRQELRVKRKGHRKIKWNPEMQECYLDLYREYGNNRIVCEMLRISTSVSRYHRNSDSEFDELCLECEEDYADFVDAKLHSRAIEGVQEPLVYQGKIMRDKDDNAVMVTRHSDRLMELVAKAEKPDKYRERRETQITGPGGQPFKVVISSLDDMMEPEVPTKIKGAKKKEDDNDKGQEQSSEGIDIEVSAKYIDNPKSPEESIEEEPKEE